VRGFFSTLEEDAMNPFATAALVVIAMAQLSMAYMAIQPTPEQVHLLALKHHCKEQAKKDTAVDAYFVCVSRLSR
jgi:hypothetical protein